MCVGPLAPRWTDLNVSEPAWLLPLLQVKDSGSRRRGPYSRNDGGYLGPLYSPNPRIKCLVIDGLLLLRRASTKST